jgi:hypothetical protein
LWRSGDPLEAAEELMLACAASGEVLGGLSDSHGQGLAAVSSGQPVYSVRAEVLRYLLMENDWPVGAKGVRLRGVRVTGLLDLEAARARCPLWLDDCDLDDRSPIVLDFAVIPLLHLARCRFAGLSANALSVTANLDLSGSAITGPVRLTGARIGNGLICIDSVFGNTVALSGARIEGSMLFFGARVGADEDGNSLVCNGMSLRLSAHLRDGFRTDGCVVMSRADIGGDVIIRSADIGVNAFGTSVYAPRARVGGAVDFSEDFTAQGAVQFSNSRIGGQFRCSSARLGTDGHGNSLVCDGMRTGGNVNLDIANGTAFTAGGAVRMAGAEITGSLSCRGARLGANQDSNALIADEMKVSVAVLLNERLTATGAIRVPGANIAGQLTCQGSRIAGTDHDGNSLVATGVKVGGPAQLDSGFTTAGAVDLSGADVSGQLSLGSAELGANNKGHALFANGMRTGRDIAGDGGVFGGGIWLPGAEIGGSLRCRGIRLGADGDQNALMAVRLKVGGEIVLDRLISAGAVVVAGAEIGGRLCCRGATLNGSDRDGDVFSANGAKIGGSMFLNGQTTTDGAVQLSHVSIGGSLHCSEAKLAANRYSNSLLAEQANVTGGVLLDDGFTADGAVSLRGANIGRELRWEPGNSPGGEVNLEGVRCHQLTDNWASPRYLAHWPAGRLRLTGFTYDGFGGHSATVNQRLDWIRSQYVVLAWPLQHGNPAGPCPSLSARSRRPPEPAPFTTQPYKQLADVYRRAGQDDEAQTVEIAMRRDRRKHGNLSAGTKFFNWLLDITIRYGYETRRALVAIALLYILVFLAFWFAQHQGNLVAASNVQNTSLHPAAMHCVTGYPCFYPAGYAFDVVVPLINIRQADFWQANGHHAFGWAWVSFTWIATALGWFLATLLVVGYSGLAKRQ